ncbi:sensor histidine kinase [Uliginosibacterium sp. H1]|uniref:sensor histidine kinase n=1 Tax=Uliginosibacterium sp. H1 TaxID=3114757 RepID=UPI002E19A522|nr:PAS domain S-box protein [Uliginosibacterium sp. H1]
MAMETVREGPSAHAAGQGGLATIAGLGGEVPIARVLDSLFTYVWTLTPDGTLIAVNRVPLDAAGIDPDSALGRPFWECPWWDHDDSVQELLRNSVARAAAGETARYDIVARLAGDSRTTLDFMLAPMNDQPGHISHLIASAIDISDRKSSEEALRLSEERFRAVVEVAPDGMAMVNRDGRIVLVNRGLERMFGHRREEMIGQPVEMLMPDRYRDMHHGLRSSYLRSPTTRDMAGRRELFALRRDGSEFPVEIGLNALQTADGMHVLATIVDVTKRKADQTMLNKSLEEKTVLLNEVHHRVKNNLQVISSLLNLQSSTSTPEARVVLAESQSRVKAMALIHQLLYERNDFSRIELSVYIARLASLLRETFLRQSARITLNVSNEAMGLGIDLQRAVPCGLLVNELVTNAIKHAFPDDRPGRVDITLRRSSDGSGCIIVADDGIGLAPDKELGKASSLGFQLIPLLVEQLGGEIGVSREGGTVFTLFFHPEDRA